MPRLIRTSEVEDGIVEVRLDDESGGNHLTQELCDGLIATLEELTGRPDVKVLILSGTPDVFCAGAPRDLLESLADGSLGRHVRDLDLPARLVGFPVPTIAAMEGHAVGGGLAIALCCDLRVAALSKRYGFNFTDLGFTPGMGTTALAPMLAGHALGAEMLMTAKLYKGRELAGSGLLNAVVEGGEVMGTALDLARRLADKPRHVLELLKRTLAAPRLVAVQEAMANEHRMHEACFVQTGTGDTIRQNYHERAPEA
jgi:polyketide biosynthesis enoyl-CoA hydratase PksI